MINDSWCNHNNIQQLKSFCSPNLEYLTIKCQPNYLPREFSSAIFTTVYIPPQADTKMALKELHWTLCKLETIYREAAFIVAGINKANLRTRLPKFYQHIDCTLHGGNTLHHCHSNFRDAYKALPQANPTTTPSCSYRLIGRNSNRMCQWLEPFNVALTNRNPRFKIVLITRTGICSG